jgi:hypothetical protein
MGVQDDMEDAPHDSLSTANAPWWRHEPGFSEEFAGALIQAYHHLRSARNDPDAYLYAAAAVLPYRSKRLSVRQRLRLEYVLAQAFTGEDGLTQALDHLEEAADMAEFLDEPVAGATIGSLAGKNYHYLSEFAIARDLYTDSVELLHSHETRNGSADTALEADLLIRIAGLNCDLADFSHAEEATRTAHLLLNTSPASESREVNLATLDWIDTLVAHWTGHPEQALPKARAVADTYTRLGNHRAAGRVHGLVVEIALDLAGSFSLQDHPGLRAAFTRQARPHALAAIEHARAAGDPIGAQLGRLALQRCRRMRAPTQDGVEIVERVIRRAQRLGDAALLGRAQLALGEELAARASWDGARQLYGMARHTFEEFDLQALLTWPNCRLSAPGEP